MSDRKFEQMHGMTALKQDGKILGWVLKTCNWKWCIKVTGNDDLVSPKLDTKDEAEELLLLVLDGHPVNKKEIHALDAAIDERLHLSELCS